MNLPTRSQFFCRSLFGTAVLLVTLGVAGPGVADEAADSWDLCTAPVTAAGVRHGLPPHLLAAVSKVESGRWNGAARQVLPWPWTVMAEGKGRYLPSKAAAVAEVRALQARGIRNIDVGCLQINLHYHPDAFESLEAAFDPQRNADYAAGFLSRLRQARGSWTGAIGDYHSKTIRYARPYRLKVFRAWREERHEANRLRRAAIETGSPRKSSRTTAAPASVKASIGVWR